MNFTEAVAEVSNIVKRPDKMLDMRREVNAAVNFFSSDANFKRDVLEVLVPLIATQHSQNIPFTLLPRFRKVQYIKRAGTLEYLTELDARQITTAKCSLDKYYIAGSGLKINMSKTASFLDLGYYQYPDLLTDIAPAHWILDVSPYMVIDRAASAVFKAIGDDSSSKSLSVASSTAYLAFRTDTAY